MFALSHAGAQQETIASAIGGNGSSGSFSSRCFVRLSVICADSAGTSDPITGFAMRVCVSLRSVLTRLLYKRYLPELGYTIPSRGDAPDPSRCANAKPESRAGGSTFWNFLLSRV
jgi:hypothetical protein